MRRQLALEWGVVPGWLPPLPASIEEHANMMLERGRDRRRPVDRRRGGAGLRTAGGGPVRDELPGGADGPRVVLHPARRPRLGPRAASSSRRPRAAARRPGGPARRRRPRACRGGRDSSRSARATRRAGGSRGSRAARGCAGRRTARTSVRRARGAPECGGRPLGGAPAPAGAAEGRASRGGRTLSHRESRSRWCSSERAAVVLSVAALALAVAGCGGGAGGGGGTSTGPVPPDRLAVSSGAAARRLPGRPRLRRRRPRGLPPDHRRRRRAGRDETCAPADDDGRRIAITGTIDGRRVRVRAPPAHRLRDPHLRRRHRGPGFVSSERLL